MSFFRKFAKNQKEKNKTLNKTLEKQFGKPFTLHLRNNGVPHWIVDPEMSNFSKIEVALDRWEELAIFHHLYPSKWSREAYHAAYDLLLGLVQGKSNHDLEYLAGIEQRWWEHLLRESQKNEIH